MQKKWILALSLSLTLTTLGCAVPAIPFLDGAPAQDSAPIMVDADTLSTMIAEAAAQKVAQTLAAIPPTLVPTVALTQTPAPTATQPPTPTLTPTAYPQKGSELIAAEEGYIYYDYSTGYQIITPPNWLAIRPGEVEYAEAWGLPVASYPAVSSALQSMQSLDPNTYRLFVLDTQDGHFENSYLSNINILLSPADGASLDEIFAASVLTLPDQIPGLLVTDSNITQTEHATRMGLITSEWGSQLAAGESLRIYQQQALFVLNDTALVITFSSTVDFKDNILADFETVLTSLTPLE
jgi:hypothetical protein